MKLYLQILVIGILIFSSNCQQTCADNYFLDRDTRIEGVQCAQTCLTGYTDQPDGSTPSSPLERNCQYCITGLIYTSGGCNCAVNQQQYLTSSVSGRTCGTACDFGYTYNSDGSAPSSNSLGHCLYCLKGLVNNNGVCECAISGQYLTSISAGKCGTACDSDSTYNLDGTAPGSSLTGHCFYCVSAQYTFYRGQCYQKCPNNEYFTQNDGTCGTSCVQNYTENQFGQTPAFTLDNNCQYCTRFHFLLDQKCYEPCPDTYYGDVIEKRCIKCNQNCLTCYGRTSNNCLSCPSSKKYYLNYTCYEECPSGYLTMFNNCTQSQSSSKILIFQVFYIIIMIIFLF